MLQASAAPRGGDDEDVRRPAWQWVGFGAVAILTAWLPLSALVGLLGSKLAGGSEADPARVARAGAAIVGMHVVALALAAFGGGFIVGRWGGSGVGVRAAGLAGLVAGLAAVTIASVASGVSPWAFSIVAISLPAAAAGGWRGMTAR
ncbi:MAG: hypothetical protein ACRENE_28370 [Polyangiaceae bacterium]